MPTGLTAAIRGESPDSQPEWRKPFFWLVLVPAISALIVVAGGVAFFLKGYSHIDQSRAVFNATDRDSTYSNEKYGVMLRLPGRWEQYRDFNPSHFCELQNNSGIVAGFWALFASPLQTLDMFTDELQKNMLAKGKYSPETQTEMTIDGRRARMVELRNREDHSRMVIIVAKKGLSNYILTLVFLQPIRGSISATDLRQRQEVLDGLADSIHIR
jgi:hypothetical protein